MTSSGNGNSVMLPGLHKVRAKGRTYYYAYRGGPALPDPDVDPRAFAEAYARHAKRREETQRTVSTLLAEYRASPEYAALAVESKRVREFRLDRIEKKFGALPLMGLAGAGMRGIIIDWRDSMAATPCAADDHIEVLNIVFNWAVDREKIAKNPAKKIGKLYSTNRSDVIFTPDELASVLAAARPDLRLLIRAAVATGLRCSDLCDLRWRDVDIEDGIIERTTNKSARDPVKTFMAILPAMRSVLTEATAGRIVGPASYVFLREGRPWKPKQASDAFAYVAGKAGIEKHFHDLRGNAATALSAAGVSSTDIDEWMGWKPGKGANMKKRYVARREVALRMAEQMAGLGIGTQPK